MGQIRITGFREESISSSVLQEMEEAVMKTDYQSEKRPYHFVFFRNRDLLNEIEAFAGEEKCHLDAPLVILAFADGSTAYTSEDTLKAAGSLQRYMQENGMQYFFSFRLNDTLNQYRYRKIMEMMGVPEGYLLQFTIAAGHFISQEGTETKTGSVFSYVQ